MKKGVLIAGAGGQGVMTMGLVLSHAAVLDGLNVTWLPSYGAEQRGGPATCSVIVSPRRIWSPIVSEPDYLVSVNGRALEAYEGKVCPSGLIVVNASIVSRKVERADVRVVYVPANEVACEVGDERAANFVLLGALIAATRLVSFGSVWDAVREVFQEGSLDSVISNQRALRRGTELVTP